MSISETGVTIKLHTSIIDCTVPSSGDIIPEEIYVNYEGSLEDTAEAFQLRYRENLESEMGMTHTTLVFPKDQTDLCMMVREGAVNCTMSFSLADPRQLCTYQTPFGPFAFTVVTKKLSGQMGKAGGNFFVEYDLELRGVVSQHNKLSLSVTPISAGEEPHHG